MVLLGLFACLVAELALVLLLFTDAAGIEPAPAGIDEIFPGYARLAAALDAEQPEHRHLVVAPVR